MKTTILKSVFLAVLTAGMFSSCVQDDDYGTPDLSGCTETTLVKNREVSEIQATATVALHENIVAGVSDVIEAYVTSSDIGGNFFKSISFQTLDGSKAFSIPVDAVNTFIDYEPGRKVLIKMDGLYTDVKFGGMRIGGLYANSSGGAEVGRLPEAQFRAAVQPSCTIVPESQLAIPVTIAEAMSDFYNNKLIKLENVEFVQSATETTYYDANNDLGGATNHTIMDLDGTSMIFRTSAYSNFAAKPVAAGSGTIIGVMSKYSSDYQFMVRSENDIQLTGPRFTPLLNESFSSGFGDWFGYSVTGAEVWTYSATFGNPGSMAKMSGYNGGNKLNEDWFISPVQDLSILDGATLSFDNAYKFDGAAIKVYISKDYDGSSNPTTNGTWTELTGATLSAGNYVYANSGPLDISAYTGAGAEHVYIAFKYNSTTSAASTWEIDNVKITAN